jgi:hypothetical protein
VVNPDDSAPGPDTEHTEQAFGYSISDRMESQIIVDALESAIARRGVKVT